MRLNNWKSRSATSLICLLLLASLVSAQVDIWGILQKIQDLIAPPSKIEVNIPDDDELMERCGVCQESAFPQTPECNRFREEGWYAFVNISMYGVGPIANTTLSYYDPNIVPEVCDVPGTGRVWHVGDHCTDDPSQYSSAPLCGPVCECDTSVFPGLTHGGICRIDPNYMSGWGNCGKAIDAQASGTSGRVIYVPRKSNVGDSCNFDKDCGYLCGCSDDGSGSRSCQRSPWSIPSKAKTSGVVFNAQHEILPDSLDALSCLLRVLRVWNNGTTEYFKNGGWVNCFNDDWEIPSTSPCNEITGLSIRKSFEEDDVENIANYLPLARVDRIYDFIPGYIPFKGNCYDSTVNSLHGGDPCSCMCEKGGYTASGVCDPKNGGCGDVDPAYDKHIMGGDEYCTTTNPVPPTPPYSYMCCCTGNSALPHVAEKYDNYVVVDSAYTALGLLGNYLGVDETSYYDALIEVLRNPEISDTSLRDYNRIYTLARSCDIVGPVDDDATCKTEPIRPDFDRESFGQESPNYFADLQEKRIQDCTMKVIDGGKFCEWPGVYVTIMNKSRFGADKGLSHYKILGEQNITMRRIYNESIFDGDITNKNDVLDWNWWAGHRLIGCDLCLPGDDTCSMGASIAMWYRWDEKDTDPRSLCGFFREMEAWKPDEEFVYNSTKSIISHNSEP